LNKEQIEKEKKEITDQKEYNAKLLVKSEIKEIFEKEKNSLHNKDKDKDKDQDIQITYDDVFDKYPNLKYFFEKEEINPKKLIPNQWRTI